MEAIEAFRVDETIKTQLGEKFWNYLIMLKEHEVGRFLSAVTDWEQKEYFEVY